MKLNLLFPLNWPNFNYFHPVSELDCDALIKSKRFNQTYLFSSKVGWENILLFIVSPKKCYYLNIIQYIRHRQLELSRGIKSFQFKILIDILHFKWPCKILLNSLCQINIPGSTKMSKHNEFKFQKNINVSFMKFLSGPIP